MLRGEGVTADGAPTRSARTERMISCQRLFAKEVRARSLAFSAGTLRLAHVLDLCSRRAQSPSRSRHDRYNEFSGAGFRGAEPPPTVYDPAVAGTPFRFARPSDLRCCPARSRSPRSGPAAGHARARTRDHPPTSCGCRGVVTRRTVRSGSARGSESQRLLRKTTSLQHDRRCVAEPPTARAHFVTASSLGSWCAERMFQRRQDASDGPVACARDMRPLEGSGSLLDSWTRSTRCWITHTAHRARCCAMSRDGDCLR